MSTPHGGLRSSLFDSFWLAAHWVWERRETAKRIKFPFSEETVTETVLLDIATANPLEIQVVPLNKRREGVIGADWEWLFFSRDRKKFLRTLVQAKVLDDSDSQYAHIDRSIGNTGVLQIDRLLRVAGERGIPALYAFYNHLTDATRVPLGTCICHECVECWGCSVAIANAVKANLPDKSFDQLSRISMPWVCLLCPTPQLIVPSGTAPDRAAAGLQRLYRLSAEIPDLAVSSSLPDMDQLVRSEPPGYFAALETLTHADAPRRREDILNELAAQNPEIDGIVLITDETEEQAP